ncbi:MAG: 5'-nucleotidase C-terminal domain-containing protein [Holophagaceae bacterium]|nr:5'-nucleotidase C-terminal domain-containing protein [Holophagaceae bacterium]
MKHSVLVLSFAALMAHGALRAQTAKPENVVALPVNATVAEDPEILKIIEPARLEIVKTFDLPLVEAPKGLLRGRGTDENLLGYWVADVMRRRASIAAGAPVAFAFTNRGGLRANLRAGMLKVGDIFELMPFENELVVIELSGAEVIKVVQMGVLRRGGEPVSGVKVSTRGPADKPEITVTWEDGSPIDPAATVKAASTDYLVGGGDGYRSLRDGRRPFTTGLLLRQVLLDACTDLAKQKLPLLPPATGRYLFESPELQLAILDKKPAPPAKAGVK